MVRLVNKISHGLKVYFDGYEFSKTWKEPDNWSKYHEDDEEFDWSERNPIEQTIKVFDKTGWATESVVAYATFSEFESNCSGLVLHGFCLDTKSSNHHEALLDAARQIAKRTGHGFITYTHIKGALNIIKRPTFEYVSSSTKNTIQVWVEKL